MILRYQSNMAKEPFAISSPIDNSFFVCLIHEWISSQKYWSGWQIEFQNDYRYFIIYEEYTWTHADYIALTSFIASMENYG